MDPGLAVDRYGTSAIVRNDREARACRREYQAPLCPSQVLLAPVGAQERRYQLPPRRVTHPCGKLTIRPYQKSRVSNERACCASTWLTNGRCFSSASIELQLGSRSSSNVGSTIS